MKECTQTGKTSPELHYNFVFFFAQYEFFKVLIGKELYHSSHSRVYETAFDGPKWLQRLFHYHWAYRINRKINLPLKRLWFRRMYRQDFDNDLPLCFVYLGANGIRYDGGWTEYVRKRDPRNRQVIIHLDLIDRKICYDYSIVRNKVDLAVTYESSEAEKYGIHYFRGDVYSKLVEEPEHPVYQQDIYFLGSAKDRLPKILAVYRKLHDAGLRCKFMIAGVAPEDQVPGDGIEYTNGISYTENLQNVICSRCLLYLAQKGSSGITVRALEAIAYRRRLLTDCTRCDPDHFNEGQLQIIDEPEDIDLEFFRRPFQPEQYEIKLDLNPMRRLYDIQDQLERAEHN